MTVGGAMRGGKCLRPNDAARRVHLVATIVLYDSDTTPALEHPKAQGAERCPPAGHRHRALRRGLRYVGNGTATRGFLHHPAGHSDGCSGDEPALRSRS